MQKLRQKPCTICIESEVEPVYRLAELTVLRCLGCGLSYVDEQLSTTELDRLYDTDNYHGDHFLFYFPGLEDRLIEDYLEDVGRIENHLPPRPRVLDVGCADGRFLAKLPERFEKYGIDISRPAIEKGSGQLGVNLICQDLLDDNVGKLLGEATFDLVTMWSILEHLQDPRRVVEGLRRLMKPGSVLVVRVPNSDGLLNTVAHLVYRWTFGLGWKPLTYFYTQLHIYNFGVVQLMQLLETCGFKVVNVFFDDRYVVKHALPYLPWYLSGTLRVLKGVSMLLSRRDSLTVCAVLPSPPPLR